MDREERLQVFEKAYAVSLEVHRVSLRWDKVEQFGGIADQLRRSSKSVTAAIAEGRGRQEGSSVEFRRYLVMALGSADESRLWCRYAKDLGYLDEETATRWREAYQEIAKMLMGLIRRLSEHSAR